MTAARQALVDAAAWYSVGDRTGAELTHAAANALVSGLDSPALRELAGLPAASSWDELSPVAERAFSELGLVFPEWQSDEGKRGALRVLASKYRRGDLPARELTSWAHSTIGHQAADDLAEFAQLDDDLDLAADGFSQMESVLASLDAAVDRLLASCPRE